MSVDTGFLEAGLRQFFDEDMSEPAQVIAIANALEASSNRETALQFLDIVDAENGEMTTADWRAQRREHDAELDRVGRVVEQAFADKKRTEQEREHASITEHFSKKHPDAAELDPLIANSAPVLAALELAKKGKVLNPLQVLEDGYAEAKATAQAGEDAIFHAQASDPLQFRSTRMLRAEVAGLNRHDPDHELSPAQYAAKQESRMESRVQDLYDSRKDAEIERGLAPSPTHEQEQAAAEELFTRKSRRFEDGFVKTGPGKTMKELKAQYESSVRNAPAKAEDIMANRSAFADASARAENVAALDGVIARQEAEAATPAPTNGATQKLPAPPGGKPKGMWW